jgi:hypothetical protein
MQFIFMENSPIINKTCIVRGKSFLSTTKVAIRIKFDGAVAVNSYRGDVVVVHVHGISVGSRVIGVRRTLVVAVPVQSNGAVSVAKTRMWGITAVHHERFHFEAGSLVVEGVVNKTRIGLGERYSTS